MVKPSAGPSHPGGPIYAGAKVACYSRLPDSNKNQIVDAEVEMIQGPSEHQVRCRGLTLKQAGWVRVGLMFKPLSPQDYKMMESMPPRSLNQSSTSLLITIPAPK